MAQMVRLIMMNLGLCIGQWFECQSGAVKDTARVHGVLGLGPHVKFV